MTGVDSEAQAQSFLSQVAEVRTALDPTTTDAAMLDRLLGRIDRPDIEPKLLHLILEKCSSIEPGISLLACLAFHRWSQADPKLRIFSAPFALAASGAIYSLGALQLFPLRDPLLTEVIEATPEEDRAEILCRRGTTRATLAAQDPSYFATAVEDFERSAALARRHRLPDLEVWAISAHLRLLRNTGLGSDPRTGQLVERLLALEPTESPLVQAEVHLARADATLTQADHDDPAAAREAIVHLRAACSAIDASTMLGQQTRERLAQELARFGTSEERREALELAREVFENRLHPESEVLSAGASFTLAVALLADDSAAGEAKEQLEAALRGYSRARNQDGVHVTRRLLAQLSLARGEIAMGTSHAEIALQHARDKNDHGGIFDAALLLLRLTSRGPYDPRVTGALGHLPKRLRIRLQVHRALALAGGSASIEECFPDLQEYWTSEDPWDEDTRQAATALAHNYPSLLPRELLQTALQWAERVDAPTLRARLLIQQGRRDEACAMLQAVQSDPSDRRRWVSASLLLLTVLSDAERAEKVRVCDEVEPFLDFGSARDAHSLFDLAQGLLSTADHDTGRLHRAWQAASAAAEHLPPQLQPLSLRQRWDIRGQQLITVRQSSERTAELAEWLADAERPPGDVDEHLLSSTFSLLFFGRLTHPRCLKVARRLLQRVQGSSGRAALLWHRLGWVSGKVDALPSADERKLPFDDAPQWLVALVQGEDSQRASAVAGPEIEFVGRTLLARPDRADAVLDWLTAETTACDVDALHTMLLALGESVVKPRHLERLQQRRTSPSFSTAMEEFQALYSAGEWGDGTPLQRQAERLLGLATSTVDRCRALHALGVERMSAYKANRSTKALKRARDALAEAATLLRPGKLPTDLAVSVLVSAGNTWRLGDDTDADKALAFYHEAQDLAPTDVRRVGQLHKVIADALLLRGKGDDLKLARDHVTRSLEARQHGQLRMETLLTAADIELAASEDRQANLQRALLRLEEALTLCTKRGVHAIGAEKIVPLSGELLRLDPSNRIAKRLLDSLDLQVPELKAHVAAARRGSAPFGDERTIESIVRLAGNPACLALAEAVSDLGGEHVVDPRMKHLEQQVRSRDKAPPTKDELHERQRKLEQESDPERRPGALVGCAIILSQLAARGEKVTERANAIADRAELAIADVQERDARVMLKLELSLVWAPPEQHSYPTQDYRRATDLLEGALEELDTDSALYIDVMLRYARATRYRTDGRPADHLKRAEQLNKAALQEARARGDEFSANQILFNLQELSTALGRGGELQNLIESISETEKIVERTGGSSYIHLAGLASDRTRLGCKQRGPTAIEQLEQGQRDFERLFSEHRLPPSAWEDAKNYQVMGSVELALRTNRPEEAIRLWRQRLSEQADTVDPSRRATTLHNLADILVRHGRTFDEAHESSERGEEALQLRIQVGNPQHLWETHHLLGDAARLALKRRAESGLNDAQLTRLWERGRKAYQAAAQQARDLGGGERLVRSGIGMADLALLSPHMSNIVATAEAAWSAIDEGRRVLLSHQQYTWQEAMAALALAERVLEIASQQDVEGHLGGSRGVVVARWLLRAAGSQQRRLGARWRRPHGVSDSVWRAWLRALKSGEVGEIGRIAEDIQLVAPFLTAEAGLTGVERWLAQHPASAAVVVLPCPSGSLAAIVTLEDGEAIVSSRLLEGSIDEAEDPLFLHEPPFTSKAYTRLLARAKRRVVQPLRELLPKNLRYLLWHGGGALRHLSPHDLWPGLAVTSALDFGLSGAIEPLHEATAIVVADPGTEEAGIPGGVEAGIKFAEVVGDATRVRLRLSRGPVFGGQLKLPARGLIDAPAAPDGVLEDIRECSRLVLMCHGGFNQSGDPVLCLVDENGEGVDLPLDRIASDPGAFVGATVILLACSAGRPSTESYRVDGLPAVFLACGARRVVAPLWPVYVEAAKEIGAALLTALEGRQRIDEAVAAMVSRYERSGERGFLSSARAFLVYEA